jgi:beta-glucosidase
MPELSALLQKMTLEEKAALCTGASSWTTLPIERLGVASMRVSDGPHGLRREPAERTLAGDSLPATCYPTASCLASTWDPGLLRRLGQALAEEAIALGVDMLLGPGVNMKRSPLGGRNFEYFSEDPYLAGTLAASLICGIQERGVGTSLKHFAANSQETARHTISAEIDERSLREIYLPAFEMAVREGRPWSVMCAYNKVNGTTCSENAHLLTEILKQEWGFEGLVVSDWGAVWDRVSALRAGLDLEMPGPKPERVERVVRAVRSGELDESVLDQAVLRILRVVLRAAETPKGGTLDVAAGHALARELAANGMVLLKNNGVLPLDSSARIAVIGASAQEPYFQGGGSSHVHPTRVARPYQELQARVGSDRLTYAEGYPRDGSYRPALIDEAVAQARAAEVALLFMALPPDRESEGYDRTDLDLTPAQVALIQAVAAVQPKCVVVLNNGAPLALAAWIDGVGAVLEAWMMGQAGAAAVADVLFGRVNPSGKLPETFPHVLADTPAFLNWPGECGKVSYGEGLFIGYRYYDARALAVSFPFGHGLSYTTFSYSQARTSASTFRDVDGVTISVDVTNSGEVAGKEVVQVYVHDRASSLVRPPKELKGFVKVELQPGETKTVSIPLDLRAFAYYHPIHRQWITEDGDFDILIGSSSVDIRACLIVNLLSSLKLTCLLDRESTLREWLDDRGGRQAINPLLQNIQEQIKSTQGSGGQTSEVLPDFLLDLPLLVLLRFRSEQLPASPESIVDGLLAQVRRLKD